MSPITYILYITRTVLAFMAVLVSSSLLAQTTEEQAEPCMPGTPYQSPSKGVLVNYAFYPTYRLRMHHSNDASKVRRDEILDVKIKAPLMNKPHLKMAMGLHYGFQNYAFGDIMPKGEITLEWLDAHNLNIAEATYYYTQSFGTRNYLNCRASVIWRGDWDGFLRFDRRQLGYSLLAVWGIKPHKDLEYGLGLRISNDPRNLQILPFGVLYRTFNRHWGLEATLPVKILARYNIAEGRVLLFGPEYTSNRSFIIQGEDRSKALQFRRSAIEISANYQHRFTKWIWLECRAAYAINFNTSIEDPLIDSRIRLRPGNRLLASFGFFVSPPKSYAQGEKTH